MDDRTGQLYSPADHPDHGEGIIFVGLEENGYVHVYALNHLIRRIATYGVFVTTTAMVYTMSLLSRKASVDSA